MSPRIRPRPQLAALAFGLLVCACPGDAARAPAATAAPAERQDREDAGAVADTSRDAAPPPMLFELDDVQTERASGGYWREGAIITGASEHRLILFSFDDGPDRNTTPQLLDTLDELGVRALFFVTAEHLDGPGPRAAEQRALVREMVARGHVVGNHTFHHRQLPLLTDLEARDEVLATERALEPLIGARPWLVRVPGGSRSPRIDAMLASRGYTQVLWNIGTGDFQVRTVDDVESIFRRVLARRERENGERGGIVLLHDLHPWSVAAVPRLVAHLEERNCALLAAGEELYDIVDDPTYFFAPRSSDPSALAPAARMPEDVHALRQRRLRQGTRARCLESNASALRD